MVKDAEKGTTSQHLPISGLRSKKGKVLYMRFVYQERNNFTHYSLTIKHNTKFQGVLTDSLIMSTTVTAVVIQI